MAKVGDHLISQMIFWEHGGMFLQLKRADLTMAGGNFSGNLKQRPMPPGLSGLKMKRP
mgnify:CR=1 FL=1